MRSIFVKMYSYLAKFCDLIRKLTKPKRQVQLKLPEPLLRRGLPRSAEEDLELWKHYASFGGEDKNRRVTIAIWLLGGSAAILWYIWTNLISPDSFELKATLRALGASMLGIVVSGFAGYVSLLYGGYSNRNWEKADCIARNRGWGDHLPSPEDDDTSSPSSVKGWEMWFVLLLLKIKHRGIALNRIAKQWAKPCIPEESLAPVFKIFFYAAMCLFYLHIGFLILSAVTICECFSKPAFIW